MENCTQQQSESFSKHPPEWPHNLLPGIQSLITASGRKVIVLDDDPTGTQTVHSIPVLTEWSTSSLEAELATGDPGFYILTNSRSMSLQAAQNCHHEIGDNIREAVENTGVQVEVISRSDSTLRGHFPGEVDELVQALEMNSPPYLIIPFFLEGGRYTLDDVHYVAEDERLIPAGQTAYARDAVFGYKHSDLRKWVEEKTNGRIPSDQVAAVSIDDLRTLGPKRVKDILTKLGPSSVCIVNAVSYRDIEVFVTGLLWAEEEGFYCLARTAASFARVRIGIEPRHLLSREELIVDNDHGGLFVVGSYVPKTTAQVSSLLGGTCITGIEVDVGRLLENTGQAEEMRRVIHQANELIGAGQDVVIYTSRNLVLGEGTDASLSIGQCVSDSLTAIVQGIKHQPRYLVAKGGITSSDVACKGLGVRRAEVLGQVLPGVPVWKLGPESRYPGMPYIVFPGNVGEIDALVLIQRRLHKKEKAV